MMQLGGKALIEHFFQCLGLGAGLARHIRFPK
jgi:hypothetical protein